MKHAIIGATLAVLAITAQAADFVVDLGEMTIKEEQQATVLSWLNTVPNLYTNEVVGGVTNRVVVPETTAQKARRVIPLEARKQLRKEIRRILTWLRQKELNADVVVGD